MPDDATSAPDAELLARARARDLAAFEELVARHQDRLYRMVMRLVRNESDAQEVLQEAFLAAWKGLERFESKAQFGSWMYRIAANAALMLLRTRRRHPALAATRLEDGAGEGQHAGEPPPGMAAGGDWSKRPDDQLQSVELREHLQHAIDALSDDHREVFVVRDVEGLSTEDTAELLGISVPNVKTRLHRARLQLREAITEYFARR